MLDYAGARAVAMIVQTGSFEGAARVLNVTQSAISQRVRNLEERLGTVLIQRGQPCTATDAGAWLCRHMEHVGMLEEALLEHLPGLANPGDVQRVTLEIATNADSLGTWFLPAVASFAQQSGYLFNIAIDDEQHTLDWLRQGRVLAAVTSRDRPVQGCMVKPLGRLRYHATASPDFVQRHFPDGVTVQALAEAPALMFNPKDNLQQAWVRQVFGQSSALFCHSVPSTQGFVDACRAGLGWGLNPAMLVTDHLASGALVEIVPKTTFDVPLFWQISRLVADRLQGLTQAVLAAAEGKLERP
ncbi:MAG: LysR family transcriptional regulator ArgP [Alphaproteobacteria bacterium]|nr:LysR family transcriptional regulator ArgP [Alphaproteobacteria bacterium]